jgi:hypothetical protein
MSRWGRELNQKPPEKIKKGAGAPKGAPAPKPGSRVRIPCALYRTRVIRAISRAVPTLSKVTETPFPASLPSANRYRAA